MSEKQIISKYSRIHDDWLDVLEKAFNQGNYATIREGKMFLEGRHWKEPDLFVMEKNQLLLILEVIVTEGYRRILKKVLRIKQYYNPKFIVIYEPVKYMDKELLPKRREHYKNEYLDYYPRSYKEIEQFFTKKWKKENDIEVQFWNENTYASSMRKLS